MTTGDTGTCVILAVLGLQQFQVFPHPRGRNSLPQQGEGPHPWWDSPPESHGLLPLDWQGWGLQISGAGRHHHIFQYFREQAGAIKVTCSALQMSVQRLSLSVKTSHSASCSTWKLSSHRTLHLNGIALDRL